MSICLKEKNNYTSLNFVSRLFDKDVWMSESGSRSMYYIFLGLAAVVEVSFTVTRITGMEVILRRFYFRLTEIVMAA